MSSLSASQIQDAFNAHVRGYTEYSESAKGRLRHAIIWHHLRAHLPSRQRDDPPLRVLDVGGGIGQLAADLAREGQSVTLSDFSPAMLEEAKRQCEELATPVTFVCADAHQIGTLFEPGAFDIVLCHSLLEFVDDPQDLLAQMTRVLRPGGVLSVVFGNRHHALLQEVFLRRDFHKARQALEGELSGVDLFGLPRRTFYPKAIWQMLEACGLLVVGEYGVRVFADLLGELPENMDALLALELAASASMPYRHMARFVQFVSVKE
jgi:S-adenosylmethionine-dependent methyltransferase